MNNGSGEAFCSLCLTYLSLQISFALHYSMQHSSPLWSLKQEVKWQLPQVVIWDWLPFARAATFTRDHVKLGDEFLGIPAPGVQSKYSTCRSNARKCSFNSTHQVDVILVLKGVLELGNPGTGVESQNGPLLLIECHLEAIQEWGGHTHSECVFMVHHAEWSNTKWN